MTNLILIGVGEIAIVDNDLGDISNPKVFRGLISSDCNSIGVLRASVPRALIDAVEPEL